MCYHDVWFQDPNWSRNYLPQIGVYDPDIADKQRWSPYDAYAHYTLKDINEYYKPEGMSHVR